ncbi:MAG TPA: SDR family NAD(P)-dependent oxidoreductase [Bacteroidia bacterium]|jgi:NAD(P)-dependent dehydrogenase (short-subunit alcohol dehydrogenase family)
MLCLKDKTLLITGRLTSLGKACLQAASNAGANIIVAGDAGSGGRFVEGSKGMNAIFFPCDLSEPGEVGAVMRRSAGLFGSIDIVLNNNVFYGSSSFQYCLEYELDLLRAQGQGNIINISAFIGQVGKDASTHYVTARHGVPGFHSSTLLEYSARGVRINAIGPGFTGIPFGAGGRSLRIQKKENAEGGMTHAEQALSNLFIFLASTDSATVFGTTLEVNSAVPSPQLLKRMRRGRGHFHFPGML